MSLCYGSTTQNYLSSLLFYEILKCNCSFWPYRSTLFSLYSFPLKWQFCHDNRNIERHSGGSEERSSPHPSPLIYYFHSAPTPLIHSPPPPLLRWSLNPLLRHMITLSQCLYYTGDRKKKIDPGQTSLFQLNLQERKSRESKKIMYIQYKAFNVTVSIFSYLNLKLKLPL